MSKVEKFEDLRIWKEAIDIAVHAFKLFESNGIKHNYALKDQLLRASLSISNNIAEGFEYNNNNDFRRYLRYAKGSTGEVRSMYYFLNRIELISNEEFSTQRDKLNSLAKQQKGLINYLDSRK